MVWKILINTDEKKKTYVECSLRCLGVRCEKKCLETGDYWVIREDEDGDEVWCIIERKTPSDMYSSIVTPHFSSRTSDASSLNSKKNKNNVPRYWDQATRMNAHDETPFIFYMLVGKLPANMRTSNKWKTLYTSLTAVQMAMPRIHLIHLDDENQVPYQLMTFLEKSKSERSRTITPDTKDDTPRRPPRSTDVNVVCAKRKASDNPTLSAHLMLATIHGVSDAVAAAITEQYPNGIQTLIEAYQRCHSNKKKRTLLKNIVITRSNKRRKLGPILSERIYISICGVRQK